MPDQSKPGAKMFPGWRGGPDALGGWSQLWDDSPPQQRAAWIPAFDYPVWVVLCRGGQARFREVCENIRLPTDRLWEVCETIRLPTDRLWEVCETIRLPTDRLWEVCETIRLPTDRLWEVCETIRLPTDRLSIKLPPLFDIHEIPKVFREDSIISGYRHPRSSALDCVLSSFHLNNETVNIWTHFLPTWYFLWRLLSLSSSLSFLSDSYTWPLLVYLLFHIQIIFLMCSNHNPFIHIHRYFLWRLLSLSSSLSFLSDSYTWPLLVYLLLVCVYPFTSSCAHTFSTMSPESRHICYFFDYGALSLYSLGCAMSYGYYVVPDSWVNSWIHQHFVPIGVINSLICTCLSCYSRFLELQFPQRSKALRTGAFILPFIFDTVPLFYRMLDSSSINGALSNHLYHLVFALLTCFLFTAHLPERLFPGRFDYLGHSHQLFHVSAVVGTHFQMEGILSDMMSRRAWLVAHGNAPTFLGTVGVLAVSLALNLAVIGVFSVPLLWTKWRSRGQTRTATTTSTTRQERKDK